MKCLKSHPRLNNLTKYVFIVAPSIADLENRLEERGTSKEEMEQRLAAAKSEIEIAEKEGLYDHIIVTDIPEIAYKQFKQAVFN